MGRLISRRIEANVYLEFGHRFGAFKMQYVLLSLVCALCTVKYVHAAALCDVVQALNLNYACSAGQPVNITSWKGFVFNSGQAVEIILNNSDSFHGKLMLVYSISCNVIGYVTRYHFNFHWKPIYIDKVIYNFIK